MSTMAIGTGSRWRMAGRALWRERRLGSLRLLAASVVLAVAALSSVGFFADRVRQALEAQSQQLLGADLLIATTAPARDAIRREATARGLLLADTASFQSMAAAGEGVQLVDVKAVSAGYPLRGTLRIAAARNAPDRPTRAIPEPGTAWVDERLAVALELSPGDTLQLGHSTFVVAAILTQEPDRGINFFGVAPRLMIGLDDLQATGLVQPGSRIRYRLLVAGEPGPVAAFRGWAGTGLSSGEHIESTDNARPEIRSALDRAERFLGLAALLAVVLAAVAIALGVRRYVEAALDGYAVMRCLGATQATLQGLVFRQFLLLALAASTLGVLAGFAAHGVLAALLANLLAMPLPPPGWQPAAQGFAVGLLLLAGFVVPRLVQLKRVPSLRVIRRELGPPGQGVLVIYGGGAAALFALMAWVARDLRLAAWIAGGFLAASGLFFALAWALAGGVLPSLLRAAGTRLPFALRQGLTAIAQRPAAAATQSTGLTLDFMALLLLSVTRGELVEAWRQSTPPDAPNRFLVNIQPEQVEAVAALLADAGIDARPEPMVRGRLIAIGERTVRADDFADDRARRLVEREFNLSWRPDLPPGNQVSAGRWFTAADAGQAAASVEVGLAQTLGIAVGDRLRFEVAGSPVEARVVGLRRLKWDSMRVNFFVIFPPGVLESQPASYVVSYRAPEDRPAFASELVARFPNLTVIDVSAILAQLQAITAQVIAAVQFLFLFALAAGIAVLYGTFAVAFDERRHALALMRALGGRNAQLAGALRAEFAAVGALAGILAAAGALAVGSVLANKIFDLPLAPQWLLLPLAAAGGALLVGIAGNFAVRRLMQVSPLLALRNSE
jgi:putative ABC transport system permease protein